MKTKRVILILLSRCEDALGVRLVSEANCSTLRLQRTLLPCKDFETCSEWVRNRSEASTWLRK